MAAGPANQQIADSLDRIADLLEAQDAQTFRVRAYRNAAARIRSLTSPVTDILEADGKAGLVRLPSIGTSIASIIDELVHTGRSALLERLEGQVSPEDLFTTVPGIGETLAERIHHELHIDTLEGLEAAAWDGRLEALRGFGHRRVAGIRDALAGILGRSTRRRAWGRRWRERSLEPAAAGPPFRPSVEVILDVDAEYRRRAEAGDLRRIAPRRFNPGGRRWLPILHTERGPWHFTALYSNTARAHQLGRTDDWVVIYYERDGHEDQCTVVTERSGALAGERVVRGREDEQEAQHVAAARGDRPLPPGHVVRSGSGR
jgi:hypothetical protein